MQELKNDGAGRSAPTVQNHEELVEDGAATAAPAAKRLLRRCQEGCAGRCQKAAPAAKKK
ncbi:MAG: hypothetical protein WKG07_11925 [Hymenobacter sp.]